MKKIKILNVLLVLVLMITFSFSLTNIVADVGNFDTYDSGGSWSSSDYSFGDYSSSDYGDGSGGSIGGSILIIIIIVIIIIVSNNSKKTSVISSSNFSNNTYNTNPNRNIIDEIRKNDPNFSEEKFLMWTKDLFVKMQAAWTARNFEPIRPFETKDLFEQHNAQIQEYIRTNRINVVERVAVYKAVICNYQTDGVNETISVKVDTTKKDYIIDATTSKLLEGNKDVYRNKSYIMKFVRKLGNKTELDGMKTTNCPSCGAPTEVTSSGKCEYCGSYIVTDDHDFVLSALEPAN